MSLAFLFPGQGSQAIGMLNDLAPQPLVQQTLAEASDAIEIDLQSLIANGPKEQLDLTLNTQPVILAASIAIYRYWRAQGGSAPQWVAGHSLGEYSALVAAEALDFRDAIQLVRFRAQYMQEAVPVGIGGMAAILGLSDDEVRAVCAAAAQHEVVEAVNYNAPEQVVIAGHKSAVERACQLAKEKGAKRALPLAVSAPFHSRLLQPASDLLAQKLPAFRFKTPTLALINNVDVAHETDPAAIQSALVRQAARPVRWVETIQRLADNGVTQFVECGPGKVLSGLVKRITPQIPCSALNDLASIDQLQTVLDAAGN